MERQTLDAWVQGYVRAWKSNDPDDIGRVFADDARYFTAPFREPISGREAIVADWIERKDEPETWQFAYEILAVAGDLGFVQGKTEYTDGPTTYSNLWVIRLDDEGRCREFTEWWMEQT